MRTLVLSRYGYLPTHTPGKLFFLDQPDIAWATLEPPWKGNKNKISCIPEGTYHMETYVRPIHGTVWQVRDVPGRENIQIHVLNFVHQTEGCIGIGSTYGVTNNEVAIFGSGAAFAELMKQTADDTGLMLNVEHHIPPMINWRYYA